MSESKICYRISQIEKATEFEQAVLSIKGVVGAKVDTENMTFCYEIDEWTSDYDVFTEIMNMVDDYGVCFDFSSSDEKREQISGFEIHGDEEMGVEFLENGLEVTAEKEEKDSPKPKKKKINEKLERLIEIGVSLLFFGLSFAFNGVANFIFLALAFALAGYDILYEAFMKIVKREFFSEELVISIALFCSVFLGYSTHTVGACLIWTLSNFTIKHLCDCAHSGKVAYFKPEKLSVLNADDEAVEVDFDQVKIGDRVKYAFGSVCALDASVIEECKVRLVNGKRVTLNAGESVYAGDMFLEEATVIVLSSEEDNKNHAYNQKAICALEQKSALEQKLARIKTFALPILFVVCLLIAFIPPIFASTYLNGLYRWGYTAVIILATCSFSLLNGSLAISIYSALKAGRLRGVYTGGYEQMEKLANASECAFAGENGIFDEGGNLKQNVKGAIRELRDCDVKKFSLVTSASESLAESVCVDCKINEFYAERNEEQKAEILKQKQSEGAITVGACSSGEGVAISFNADKEGYCGDACVMGDDVRSVPYLTKLAKRTQKIKKTNLILTILSKVVITGLAIAGIAGLWWAMLIDVVIGIIAILNGLRNASEVI